MDIITEEKGAPTQFVESTFEIKGVEEDGTFEGYAGVFNNIDSHRDILMPGSTKKTLRESKGKIPILADHWRDDQIGWNTSAKEDDTGIFVKGALNLVVQKAKEKHALAKQAQALGAPIGLSIGYITKEYTIDHDKEIRKLLQIDLKEYSFVAFPSNTRASVLSIKSIARSLDGFDITEDPRALEGLLREVGFSISVSKKTASTAIALSKGDVTDKHLREVDENEAKDVLEAMRIMNAQLEMSSMNSK